VEAKVAKLPRICDGVVAPETPAATATPEQARAKQVETLATAYRSCVDTATKQKQPVAMCDGIRERMSAAAK
jgi:hypothetical protein